MERRRAAKQQQGDDEGGEYRKDKERQRCGDEEGKCEEGQQLEQGLEEGKCERGLQFICTHIFYFSLHTIPQYQ